MRSSSLVLGVVLSFSIASVACTVTTTDGSQGSSSGGTSSSGAPAASSSSGGTGTSSGSSGTTSGPKECPDDSPTSTTCTDAEMKTYGTCIQNACDATFQECYGPDYAKGAYAGACGDYMKCTDKCACGDTACEEACGQPAPSCVSCMQKFATCAGTCQAPACLGDTGTQTGNKTCADLSACCAAMPEGEDKTNCQQALELAGNNDVSCSAMYGSLCK